jgi:glycosyltransferase involved in cell wall biosynthesis
VPKPIIREKLRALIAVTGIYDKPGGGESFFKGLIERNPEIEFSFFRHSEEKHDQPLPANARVVDLSNRHRALHDAFGFDEFRLPLPDISMAGESQRVARVLDMAASVAGECFDIIEIPDYLVHGWLLPFALHYFNVKVGKVVLSMHGTISDALYDNWAGDQVGDLTLLERTESLLYRIADVRYGIGERYIGAWAKTETLPAQLLGHQYVFDYERFTRGRDYRHDSRQALPDLAFVGRQDRWKGPDLFIELCAELPKTAFRYVHLYGPTTEVAGASSLTAVTQTANNRGLKFQSNRVLPWPMLQELLATRVMVTVLPSRRDTFNLIAVESLLHGCPTVLSTRAGAVDFLDKALPGLPYIKLNIAEIASSFGAIIDLCTNYEDHRKQLRDYLEGREPLPYGRAIGPIYDELSTADPAAVRLGEELGEEVLRHVHDRVLPTAERSLRRNFNEDFIATRGWSEYEMGSEIFETALDVGATVARLNHELNLEHDVASITASSEVGDRVIHELAPIINAADRSRIYRLLAFLERERGNDLLFATYLLRHFRRTGRSPEPELAIIERILDEAGLVEEARVARLMFSGDDDEAYRYLHERVVSASLTEKPGVVERIDRRDSRVPKLSVIVSIYNGARKIPHFVGRLAQLTEAADGITEFIFVDSNSSDDTRTTLLAALERPRRHGPVLSALYLRTERRETIQHAWNRGITAARGCYLSFLGVDEALRPDAVERLVGLLERHPDTDWAQGSALVTEVDDGGAYVRDIFPHRRSTDSQNIHYLECCHIGYVGAAYRRILHQRFGLYDPRFRGAGDNEFKNRILPFIRVETVPDQFGTFLNYPEARTTESPVAELEDLRAWYLHRTRAGVRYAFERQSDDACVAQFFRALKYRQSFSNDDSSDVDYAATLADYLLRYRPRAFREIEIFHPTVITLLHAYRGLDELLPTPMRPSLVETEERGRRVRNSLWEVAQSTLTQIHRGVRNAYWYRNDNRNQQHYFLWPSVQRRFSLGKPLGWGDLAGAGNLAEIVEACVRRADSTGSKLVGNVGSKQELAKETVLHAVVLTAGPPNAVVELLDSLVSSGDSFTIVIVGSIGNEVRRKAPNGVYFADQLASVRPLVAAAQMIVLPALDKAAGQSMVRDFVTAAGYGRPMLVGAGLDAAVHRFGMTIDLTGLPRCDRPDDFWPALRHLIDVPEARRRIATISAGIGEQLRAAGILKGSSAMSPPDLMWEQEISTINATLRASLEGEPTAGAKIGALAQMLRTRPGYVAKVEAVLGALFVDKNAPILGSERYPFVMLRHLRPVGSPTAALALLYAAADKVRGTGTAVSPSHRLNAVRLELSGTPLDAWRRGEIRSVATERQAGPPRIFVLVCPEQDDCEEFRRLVKELLVPVIAETGAELFSNAALKFPAGAGGVQIRSISTAVDIARTRADLALCVGSAAARLSPESLRMGSAAMRSGRPVLGDRKMFWYLDDLRPRFVCNDYQVLRAKVTELLADPGARGDNLTEVSRSFFADDPWIVVEKERVAAGHLTNALGKKRTAATEYPHELFHKALTRLVRGQPVAPRDVRRLPLFLSDSGEPPTPALSARLLKDSPGIDGDVTGGPECLKIVGENLRAILQPLGVKDSARTVIVSPAITIEGLDRHGAVIGRRDGATTAIARQSWLLGRQDLGGSARVRLTLRGLEDEVTGELPIGLRGFYQQERIGAAPPFRWTGPDHESEIMLPIALTWATRMEITIADLGLNQRKADLTVLHDEVPVRYDFVLEGRGRACLRAVLEPKKTVNGTMVLSIVVGKCHRSGDADRLQGIAIETLQMTMDLPQDAAIAQGENWLLRATDWVKSRKQVIKRLVANGNRARDQGDWTAAAVWYRKALDADPRRPAIWVQLGHALKEQGDRAGGEEAYRRSLALADNVADTYLQLGHVLKLQGRIAEATQAYFNALVLDHEFAYAWMELGHLGYSHNEIEGALSTGVLQPTTRTAAQ